MTLPRSLSDIVTDAVLDSAFALRRAVLRARKAVARRRAVRQAMRFTVRAPDADRARPALALARARRTARS